MKTWILLMLLGFFSGLYGCGKDSATPGADGALPEPPVTRADWDPWMAELNRQTDLDAQLATLVLQLRSPERIQEASKLASMKVECSKIINVRCEFNWEK
jgi:hypothetical protein